MVAGSFVTCHPIRQVPDFTTDHCDPQARWSVAQKGETSYEDEEIGDGGEQETT